MRITLELSLSQLEEVLFGLYEKNQFYENQDYYQRQGKTKVRERDYKEIYKETLSASAMAFELMFELINELQKNGNLNGKGV